MNTNTGTVWLMVIAATFFWGSNFNAAHALVDSLQPLTAASARFALAVLVLMTMRLWRGRAESSLSGIDVLKLCALGFFGIFGFNYGFFTALQTTSTLNAALIMALSPLLTALLATLILGSQLTLRQLLGIVVAFIGVTLVITSGHLSALHVATGDWWMLMSSFAWSLYSVLLQKLTPHIPPMQQARWTVAAGAAGLIAVAIARESVTALYAQTATTFSIIIYMALCGTVLAYIFWLRGVQALGPQRAMIAFNLVPVSTLLVNLAFGQWPSSVQIAGLIIVITGVWIASGWHAATRDSAPTTT